MVAAVVNANTAFFMSNLPFLPEHSTGIQAKVSRHRHLRRGRREFNIDERLRKACYRATQRPLLQQHCRSDGPLDADNRHRRCNGRSSNEKAGRGRFSVQLRCSRSPTTMARCVWFTRRDRCLLRGLLLQGCVDGDYRRAGTKRTFARRLNRESIAASISSVRLVDVRSPVDPLQPAMRRPL